MGSSEIDRIIAEIDALNEKEAVIKGTLGETIEVLEELPPSTDGSIQVGEGSGPRVLSSWVAFNVKAD